MSGWLTPIDIVDLYNQADEDRAYWIDMTGELHFMADMNDGYLCNVMRFVGRRRHLVAALNGILAAQFKEVAGWEKVGDDMAAMAMDDDFDEVYNMSKAPWDTPLVQNLRRHIEARAWRRQEQELGT